MKIAAYQFAVSGNINDNIETIKRAIVEASGQKVELIVFPECSLSGYPPRDIESSAEVDDCKIREILAITNGGDRMDASSLFVPTLHKNN